MLLVSLDANVESSFGANLYRGVLDVGGADSFLGYVPHKIKHLERSKVF
jgi:hypothetical protein